tara:strand:- start:116 stop:283 length:168 start_codon:yes stop_codon:yes gene_type:complete
VHQIAFLLAAIPAVVPPLDADGARLELIDPIDLVSQVRVNLVRVRAGYSLTKSQY